MSNVNRISLKDALDTLKAMFPNESPELLKSYVLKTKGHMERTVELLLARQMGTPTIPSRQRALSEKDFHPSIPENFLRYGQKRATTRRVNTVPNTANDEMIARRLQNEILSGANDFPQRQSQQQFREYPNYYNNSSNNQNDQQSNNEENELENFAKDVKKGWKNVSNFAKKQYSIFKKKLKKKKKDDNGGEYQPLKLDDDEFDDLDEIEMNESERNNNEINL